ncbi:MAG: hypothetical protein LBH05_09305 [Deferribacteraceae bacterium]|jgi:hypothetical protein|nr:hypothetical protein [Deferribacteraceae bacterium]
MTLRVVERPKKIASVNNIVSINNYISDISAEDLVNLRFLFKSDTNYAERIVQNASVLPGLNGGGNTAPLSYIVSEYNKVGEVSVTR